MSDGSVNTWGIPDPSNVNLDDYSGDNQMPVICYLNNAENEYNGMLGARISAVFVLLVTSSAVTFLPVLATRTKVRIPLYVYLFARYFGAGVIVATAFIHLLDPAYGEIGPQTCVGMTNGWNSYSWVPALSMASALLVFLMDFGAERYVEKKYGMSHGHGSAARGSVDVAMARYSISQGGEQQLHRRSTHQHLHSADQDVAPNNTGDVQEHSKTEAGMKESDAVSMTSEQENRGFEQQIAAFLILEFGVLFHSVIIGLTLGSVGEEFSVLYPVIVFHQAFEGLGIGARLSAIPFPRKLHWLPWILCLGYGLTTPIAVAIGIGVRTTYVSGSFTASIVSGLLDSISSGILIYTGFVELLARDFLFNPDRTNNDFQLTFMLCSMLLGAGLMALLGKWA